MKVGCDSFIDTYFKKATVKLSAFVLIPLLYGCSSSQITFSCTSNSKFEGKDYPMFELTFSEGFLNSRVFSPSFEEWDTCERSNRFVWCSSPNDGKALRVNLHNGEFDLQAKTFPNGNPVFLQGSCRKLVDQSSRGT
jgi:hypothetical protein